MSGHSKWNNIKHKKEKTDIQRAKVFTKIGREITQAVKELGPDPASNTKLRDLIAKAKDNNVPSDNIDRVIKKAAGDSNTENYENITYEGYGPCGIAVIVDCLTDNRNRTAGNLRHYFDKNGGNLGQSGSVNWMFSKKGVIVIDKSEYDEEALMEKCMEAPIDDFVVEDEVYEIYTQPDDDFRQTRDFLKENGYTFISAEEAMVPSTYAAIDSDEQKEKMQKLLDMLEDDDDVQNVYHNWNEE